jgi:hypothetical protein
VVGNDNEHSMAHLQQDSMANSENHSGDSSVQSDSSVVGVGVEVDVDVNQAVLNA